MSSPVAAAAPTGMDRIKYYNEADNTWSTLSGNMEIGKGYIVVPVSGTAGILFTGGALNTGTKTINLTRTPANTTNVGFNLVGNPYPSYLNWQSVYNYTPDG